MNRDNHNPRHVRASSQESIQLNRVMSDRYLAIDDVHSIGIFSYLQSHPLVVSFHYVVVDYKHLRRPYYSVVYLP